MDAVVPVALLLFNYDTDRDAGPGLVVKKGGSGFLEPDPRHQHWRTSAQLTSTRIKGNVTFDIWAAMKDFNILKSGTITVYLADSDGASSTIIAQQSAAVPGTATWALRSLSLNAGDYILPAGHSLEITLIVNNSSGDDIWFAYDTIAYPSRVKINQ